MLVAHTFLGKAKTTEDRLRIEQTIRDLNLDMDRPFLPGYNLGEALKVLSKFQFYFRKHFLELLNKNELSQLEQKESKTLRTLWALWFFSLVSHHAIWMCRGRAALAQLDSRIKAIQKCIEKTLKIASTGKIKFCSLGESMQFENEPALWIAIAGDDPLEIYSQIEELFKLIRESLGDIRLNTLEHFALEIQWQHFVIVPICQGKLLEKHAWAIPVYQFITELNHQKALSPINLVPRQIEKEVLNHFNLEIWEPELLKDPIAFFQNAAMLHLRLKHLIQIGNIPDLDETGTRMIQSYFDQLKEGLSGNLQQMIDKVEMLDSQCNQLAERYQGTFAFEYLQLATDQLNEIYDKLIPNGLENGQVALSIENLAKWQEQISSVQGELFIIYLLWCGYIISQYKH